MHASTSTSSLPGLAAQSADPVVLRAEKLSNALSSGLRHTPHSHHSSNASSPEGDGSLQPPPLAPSLPKGRLPSFRSGARGSAFSRRGALRHLPLLCFLAILTLALMSLLGSYLQMHSRTLRSTVSAPVTTSHATTSCPLTLD